MRWNARTNDGDELDKGAALVEPFWGIASPDSPTDEEEFSVYARQRLPTTARDGFAKQLLISIELLWPLLPNGHKANGHPSLSHLSSYISFRLVVASALQIALCPTNSTTGSLKKRIDGVGDSEPSM